MIDTMLVGEITHIFVGMPQSYGVADAPDPHDRAWTTAFYKEPAPGVTRVWSTHMEGDAPADPKNHGGPEKAVFAYAAAHYPRWRAELERPEIAYGMFGENLTITGFSEETVCIGDTYAIGNVRLQVSQPREPCWKLARRLRDSSLVKQVQANGRTGWHHRVLQEGEIAPGLPVVLIDRPYPEWTVQRANRVRYARDAQDEAADLAACALLAPYWRHVMSERAKRT